MAELLKPCPMCGASGNSLMTLGNGAIFTPFVLCLNCQFNGPDADTTDQAEREWNALEKTPKDTRIQTLTLCDWCHRGFPAREMSRIVRPDQRRQQEPRP